MYIISEALCFFAYFFNDICNSLGKSIHPLAEETTWMDSGDRTDGPTDDGLIEVATFVVRTLFSR